MSVDTVVTFYCYERGIGRDGLAMGDGESNKEGNCQAVGWFDSWFVG
jgi:hypothetical protein